MTVKKPGGLHLEASDGDSECPDCSTSPSPSHIRQTGSISNLLKAVTGLVSVLAYTWARVRSKDTFQCSFQYSDYRAFLGAVEERLSPLERFSTILPFLLPWLLVAGLSALFLCRMIRALPGQVTPLFFGFSGLCVKGVLLSFGVGVCWLAVFVSVVLGFCGFPFAERARSKGKSLLACLYDSDGRLYSVQAGAVPAVAVSVSVRERSCEFLESGAWDVYLFGVGGSVGSLLIDLFFWAFDKVEGFLAGHSAASQWFARDGCAPESPGVACNSEVGGDGQTSLQAVVSSSRENVRLKRKMVEPVGGRGRDNRGKCWDWSFSDSGCFRRAGGKQRSCTEMLRLASFFVLTAFVDRSVYATVRRLFGSRTSTAFDFLRRSACVSILFRVGVCIASPVVRFWLPSEEREPAKVQPETGMAIIPKGRPDLIMEDSDEERGCGIDPSIDHSASGEGGMTEIAS
uniref:Transmembrane protein n=1 Tax=Chromera velia CCMP2878 TaxID=1169474 RepID=A0A0G4G570_9ALVE|eukprot:Cvel_4196.t1-p1 / transcript=Cvel_4196.t1 / gene=Cvel_4196 / organism=Chromera_velia_CCMP2878 / gene_product=hypothetical protein / transcript_product=hypothetical protein / location=Cvel_scaffold181:36584-37954(+) / protein_length=457 / sequence_SO=supercontig / SO=protein_coding / is_pseudo=false